MPAPTTGVLLINLGTPASTSVRDVRRYLREFLGDPRVMTLPSPLRRLLLEGVILPLRPRRSAAAYRAIWLPEGSPLLVHGRALERALADALGAGFRVELGMRYGEPSLVAALARLRDSGVRRILALPLFPQSAEATTGSVAARLRECAGAASAGAAPVEVLPGFCEEAGFIGAWRTVAAPVLADFAPEHVLFSYHGLPERQVRRAPGAAAARCLAEAACCEVFGADNRNCYRAQCFATSRALMQALDLAPERCSTAFQSRLGPVAWIGPHTDARLADLARAGIRRVAVLCPAFVADCLETLEEIGLRAAEDWQARCGGELRLVPSLNAHPAWVAALAARIRRAG